MLSAEGTDAFLRSGRTEPKLESAHPTTSRNGKPDPRPTVCQVLHTLHVGGGEILARSYALENSSQFRPVFALLDELGSIGRELRDMGYTVEVLDRRPGFDFACVRKLRRLLRRENVSLIHAHQCGPLFYSALARLPSRRIPILFTEHGRDYPDYRRWKRVYANRLLLTRRDRFVAVGECVRKALVEYEGLPTERIQVFYNGRDLSDYQPDRPLRSQVRDELGLSPDSFVVMQVARLNRLKDYPTALRSMARLAGQAANAVLVIVGDGEDRQEIERLIAELRLQQVVRLLGSRNDVPRLLQAADAFLLTSVTEGIPLTVIEAMATALPCVATRVGGMPEVIAEGETGFLAEAGDDGELARQLARLSADPAARERMGRAGRKRALACFDAAAMHRSYRKLYHELI